MKSPYLDDLTLFEQGNQWVFYDVIGLFTVFYTVSLGTFLNYSTVVIVFLLIAYRLNKRFYSMRDLLHSFIHHALAAVFMFGGFSFFVLHFDLLKGFSLSTTGVTYSI